MNTDKSRRSFFATLALGVSASAFPMMVKEFNEMENIPELKDIDVTEADAWFINNIKGHKKNLKSKLNFCLFLVLLFHSSWFPNPSSVENKLQKKLQKVAKSCTEKLHFCI